MAATSSKAQFVVGSIKNGVAMLCTDDLYVVDMPAALLPGGIKPGCVVDISMSLNSEAEEARSRQVRDLQDAVLERLTVGTINKATAKRAAPLLTVPDTEGRTATALKAASDALASVEAKNLEV